MVEIISVGTLADFDAHYHMNRHHFSLRLADFAKLNNADSAVLFREMAFCVFAANSSAAMGIKAVELLDSVLLTGSLKDYKVAVHKKVRFYNIRSEFLHYNREFIASKGGDLRKILMSCPSLHAKRQFLTDHFKGFGHKESSHFLRNIGFRGLCIIDKHVLSVLFDLGVLVSKEAPKSQAQYLQIESAIKAFAKTKKYDIDELDLALWSFRTGVVHK